MCFPNVYRLDPVGDIVDKNYSPDSYQMDEFVKNAVFVVDEMLTVYSNLYMKFNNWQLCSYT